MPRVAGSSKKITKKKHSTRTKPRVAPSLFKKTLRSTKGQKKKSKPLWLHQRKTIKSLNQLDRAIDTSDPGTGKSRAHLVWFDRHHKKNPGCLLIIGPKSLLQPAWGEDLKEFFPHLTFSIAYAENRKKAFEQEADVYMTNTDAVKWLAKQSKKFFKKFSVLIIDELQYFKHRTSDRSKALKAIKHHFKYRRGLGATPTANTICDLWHQMLILDDGKRLGQSFSRFRSAVCVPEQIGPRPEHLQWKDKKGAEEAVTGLIKDMSIRHQFEECMDIPKNYMRYIKYILSPRHLTQYLILEANSVLHLEDQTITAINAAVLRNKLLQLASGAVYSTDSIYKVVDMGRYELIIDLVEARQHSIVFFNWIHQKEQLVKLAEKRGINFCVIDGSVRSIKRRNELIDAYQKGFFQTAFLHPRTGAHGLTLTKGTSTIWCSPIYEADFLKQGRYRIYRGGQKYKTETIMIEAQGTVEKIVFQRLNSKTARMATFLDILKENQK
jgi:SNF2 family DNA or RNA helicase